MAKAKKQAKTSKTAKPAAASKAGKKAKVVTKAAIKKDIKKGKAAAEKIIKSVVKEVKSAAKPLAKSASKAISQVAVKVEKTAKSLKKEIDIAIESANEVVAEAEAKIATKSVEAPVVEKASKKTKISASQMEALNDDPAEMAKKWVELKKKHGGEKVANYAMTQAYEAQQALNHKIFGWGYILKSENDRLEVLFETGLKSLISNFKK